MSQSHLIAMSPSPPYLQPLWATFNVQCVFSSILTGDKVNGNPYNASAILTVESDLMPKF